MNGLTSIFDRSETPAILQMPFRPFFLCASICASLDIFVWALFLHWGLLPSNALPPLLWHGHEMLFGFVSALIAGFLLTAVINWTNLPTVTPPLLALLVMVWLAARVVFLLPERLPYAVIALLDCAFYPLLALLVARPILKSHNRRNLFLIPLLLSLAVADVLFHLNVMGITRLPAYRILLWVIDLLVVLMLVIGGRIIPFFTERRLHKPNVRRWRWLDRGVNGGAVLLVLLDVFRPASSELGVGSLVVAVLALVRLIGWQPWRTWREPLLWVLHLGYLWLVVGLVLRGVALMTGILPEITALHAITVGALGSLAIGMMTRVTLGHTGRALTAGPIMSFAFLLVNIATVLRLVGIAGLLPLAGMLWTLAFAIYFIRFLPVMFAPSSSLH